MADHIGILLAGFGGQGVLFSGKLIAYAALYDGREVTWMPSYGPEMRGGTANCAVVVSDRPVGSPLVTEPDVLVALNQPSLDKFVDAVVPGGKIFLDASLVDPNIARDDVSVYALPVTQLANDNALEGLSNLILMGKLLSEVKLAGEEAIEKGLRKCIPPSKLHLVEPNQRAMALGASL